jgi:DNA invertase Pin-like site-specific DNA recombinase
VCCDYPHANKLTVHILAACAEHELDLIRKRTKAGLRTARRAAQKLGASNPKCRNLTEHHARRGRRLGAATIRQQAVEA